MTFQEPSRSSRHHHLLTRDFADVPAVVAALRELAAGAVAADAPVPDGVWIVYPDAAPLAATPLLRVLLVTPIDFEDPVLVQAARTTARALAACAVIAMGRAQSGHGDEHVSLDVEDACDGVRVWDAPVVTGLDGRHALGAFRVTTPRALATPLAPWTPLEASVPTA